jgi:glutamyl-tRNA synthetase
LHIGGLRTALYAYLFAKKNGGKFILRIEDTDLERKVEGANEIIYRTLKSAGLNYDEGPDAGGGFGPYVQSQRKEIYAEYARRLIERGGAYYCFCTKEHLSELHKNGAAKYDKRCLKIDPAEARRRVESGEPHVIRQNIPLTGVSSYTDLVFGEIKVDNKELEDNVLIKSDGMPTYNFANVVDDYLMGINYVIRGVEYLSSTPKYNLIYDAMGWPRPNYIHLQPIMKDANRKLSKRDGDASYEDFIAKGYLSDAIVNYIALLGWSPKDNREKLSLSEMQERFSLDGVSKSASIFDENKMRWLNSLYVKELPPEKFHALALPFYAKLDYLKGLNLEVLSRLLQPRAEVLCDIAALTAFIAAFKDFDLSLFNNEKHKTDSAAAKALLPALIARVENNYETLSDALAALSESLNVKKGHVLWIFRIALSGAAVTPGGATELTELFGKTETLARLKATLARL